MSPRFRSHHSAAIFLLLAACGDLATLPKPAQAPPATPRNEIISGEPTGADPNWPVSIKAASLSVQLESDEMAAADTWVSYNGNYADVTVTAVWNGYPREPVVMHYSKETLQFFDNTYSEHLEFFVPTSCGNSVNATAAFTAGFLTFYGLPPLFVKSTSRSASAAQPTCHTNYTYASNGGGGGRTSYQICTTTQVDYYWYYPDTNTYEYRYSDSTTECNAMV